MNADITQTDHDALILNTDVFVFPDDLDTAVSDPNLSTFFEGLMIPTDWLTPATTYREFLRSMAGMFEFSRNYSIVSGGHSVFENADLSTRLRQMTDQEQAWFLATVESLGFDSSIVSLNAQLRQLLKMADDVFQGRPFYIGDLEL